jgi:hypothetical protein
MSANPVATDRVVDVVPVAELRAGDIVGTRTQDRWVVLGSPKRTKHGTLRMTRAFVAEGEGRKRHVETVEWLYPGDCPVGRVTLVNADGLLVERL